MRIAFLCGSLEPGQDGVGDYCRRLAGEIAILGYSVGLIAYSDRYVVTPISESYERCFILRLPFLTSHKERLRIAQDWLHQHRPTWLSIQYVSYGFHPKGLAWRTNSDLTSLAASVARRHILFHEIWVGSGSDCPLRHRLIGRLQRWLLGNLYRRLKPDLSQTTIKVYQDQLRHLGVETDILPLIGNITPSTAQSGWFAGICQGLAVNPETDWILGVFGPVPAEWSALPLVSALEVQALQRRKKLLVLFIGRENGHVRECAQDILKVTSLTIVRRLGEQTSERVSAFIFGIRWAISKHTWGYHGRSGTDAAMFEHGTPVISVLDSGIEEGVSNPLLIRFNGDIRPILLTERRVPTNFAGENARNLICQIRSLEEHASRFPTHQSQ